MVNRSASGVPLPTERWCMRYSPVYSDARAGPQGAVTDQWLAKRTPRSARRSRLGVRTTGWAAAERQSPRHWSTVMNKTLADSTARHRTASQTQVMDGNVEREWFSVIVEVTGEGAAELVADAAWTLGAPAVEERAGPQGVISVVTGFADAGTAHRLVEEVRTRSLGTARVETVTDLGLDAWRAHARPESAPPFVVVPAWLDPSDLPGVPLLIDPGHTFGSGSHPTTRLVLSRLATLLQSAGSAPHRVLDVGCGSGVLAVGAALLGASAVGIDIDPGAGPATLANAELNGVADRVTFDPRPLADLAAHVRRGRCGEGFEVVVANLLAPVITELADDLFEVTAPNGFLVLSGLLADRWRATVDALPTGRRVIHVDRESDWVAVTLG